VPPDHQGPPGPPRSARPPPPRRALTAAGLSPADRPARPVRRRAAGAAAAGPGLRARPLSTPSARSGGAGAGFRGRRSPPLRGEGARRAPRRFRGRPEHPRLLGAVLGSGARSSAGEGVGARPIRGGRPWSSGAPAGRPPRDRGGWRSAVRAPRALLTGAGPPSILTD